MRNLRTAGCNKIRITSDLSVMQVKAREFDAFGQYAGVLRAKTKPCSNHPCDILPVPDSTRKPVLPTALSSLASIAGHIKTTGQPGTLSEHAGQGEILQCVHGLLRCSHTKQLEVWLDHA